MAGQQFPLVLTCIALFTSSITGAAQEQPKDPAQATDASDLGFELSKVPPPDPEKGKPVARVFYDYLYPSQVKAPERAPDQVATFIWSALREEYIDQHGIAASEKEIEKFIDAMQFESTFLEKIESAVPERELSEDQKAGLEETLRELATQRVTRWKMDKQLYRRYGGPAIFQQANPLLPIGAYRTFLKDMEEAKVFEIFDKDAQAQFWNRFGWANSTVIQPKDVDFSEPWWLQLEPQSEFRIPDGKSK